MLFVLFVVGVFLRVEAANLTTMSAENILLPFTSDGCSKFPDGIPVIQPEAWQQCCVVHDVAYWQGGTWEQRLRADTELGTCVGQIAGPGLGTAMYLGVRIGGYAGLPFTWRWGYGWKQNRGYHQLGQQESKQVEAQLRLAPLDLQDIPILSQPVFIPKRHMLSGDYCLDEVAQYLALKFGQDVQIVSVQESTQEKATGYWKTISVQTNKCSEPYIFSFRLLRASACTAPVSELLARGRVRLEHVSTPLGRCL